MKKYLRKLLGLAARDAEIERLKRELQEANNRVSELEAMIVVKDSRLDFLESQNHVHEILIKDSILLASGKPGLFRVVHGCSD